jgi:gamma-glutamyltranspeptidase/glutathione hydrolase
MTAEDLRAFKPEWVDPISTTYRGWTVWELPPNTAGIAALMMLNLMEQYPLGEYGLHSPRALHVMIEAKKLAYADMLRYVADPKFGAVPVAAMLSKDRAKARARLIDPARAACDVKPAALDGLTNSGGGDTIYLTAIDKDGNIVSLIQSLYSSFGSGVVPPGAGFMLHNRGALFTLDDRHPNVLAPRKRPLHTIIPAFMEKGDVRIGFGIMGTKLSFSGCDVYVESLVPQAARTRLQQLGHEVTVIQPRTGSTVGYGHAVMSDGAGVHFGASEPRHDGAAIPEAPPVFAKP